MTEEERDEDAVLAAEFALGLLGKDAHNSAARRAEREPGFAALVTHWEARFAPLADDLDDVPPSAAAKRALMRDLFPQSAAPRFWQRVAVWRAISVASIALVAVLQGADLLRGPETDGPLYSAEIMSDAADFRVVAVVDKSSDEVFLTRTMGSAPTGRILQVWAHGPGEPAQSVGLWPEGDSVRLKLPPEIAAVEGVLTLGVSEEPPGGSPIGLPSGRVFGTVDIPGVRGEI